MIPTTGPHAGAAEALNRLEWWLVKLARKYARRSGVSAEDFLHHLRVQILLKFHTWSPARGSLANWAAWQARKIRTDLTRTRPRWERSASHSQALTRRLMTAPGRDQAEAVEPEELAPLWAALDQLPHRKRRAIELRFGFGGDEQTFSQIGRALGRVSKERGRQLVRDAVGDLRTALGGDLVKGVCSPYTLCGVDAGIPVSG